MAMREEGMMVQGGNVQIRFPNFECQMSCDNETELSSVVEMLTKALELFEIEKAKRLLLEGVEEENRKKLMDKLMQQPVFAPSLNVNPLLNGPATSTLIGTGPDTMVGTY